ncbi:MAG TPA: PASTA domain-containing protein [Streptosporangiaceae bacterium]
MPATCPNCGKEIGPSDVFCRECDHYLGWGEGPPPQTVQVPAQPSQPGGQHAAVQVTLKSELIEVAPGNATSAGFTVKNLGSQVEELQFSVAGPEWIVVDPVVIGVFPDDEVTGTIRAAPPRKPSSVAGIAPFWLTATSKVHANVSNSAAGRVDVAPYYELAPELVPTSSSGRGLTRHHIQLGNRGNVALRIALNPTDVADGLRLGVPTVTDVAPGEVVEVPVSVYGTRRWFGRPERKTFSIIAEAPKPLEPNRLSGTRTVAPVFPRWVPAAAGLAAVGLAAALVVVPKLTAHGTPLPTPTGSSTSAASSSAASSSAASSSAASSSPATTGSGSESQVAVPDVTGDTLAQANAALNAVHLVPSYEAFYNSASPGDTNVVRTNPAANTAVAAGSTVQVFVPVQHYDMIAEAAHAQWTADSQVTPPSATLSAGTQTGTAGQVFVLTPATLEDGTVASQALEAVPPPVQTYSITGRYELPGPSIDQELFRADIGFLSGTPSGESIQYQVVAIGNGSPSVLASKIHNSGTGQVDHIVQNLPTGTTAVELSVKLMDATPTPDQVVWASPLIEETNAPPPPTRPSASPSPTSSQTT